jgi:hypothetical protein
MPERPRPQPSYKSITYVRRLYSYGKPLFAALAPKFFAQGLIYMKTGQNFGVAVAVRKGEKKRRGENSPRRNKGLCSPDVG